jgi:hypothetical protein
MAAVTSIDRPTKFRMADSGEGWHRGLVYSGHVLDFDGTDDYIDIGDLNENCRTIMLLIKPDSATESIIDLDGGTHTVTIASGVVTATGFSSPTIYVDGMTTNNLVTDDDWYHIAITTETGIDVSDMDIGRVSASYYDGQISNVMVLKIALTQTQILKSFWHPESPLPAGISNGDLVGWWPLNENNSAVLHAIDHSGNGVLGVIDGPTIVNSIGRPVPQTTVSGYSDYYWFDGADDNVSFSGITDDFDVTQYWEMEVTFYMPNGDATIFASSLVSDNRFIIQRRNNVFFVACYNSSVFTYKTTSSYVDKKLYTCTLTVNNTTITAYLDGVEMTGTSASASTSNTLTTVIGARSDAAVLYDGIIVSVEQTGKHRWTNKGGWVDEIGSTNGTVNGSMTQFRLTNGTQVNKDAYGYTLINQKGLGYYNGNEYVETWDTDNLDIIDTITLAAWVKFSATGSQETVIGKEDTYELAKSSGETVIISIYQTTNKFTLSTSTLSVDTWYYIAGTYDGSAGEMKIYINGVLDKTDLTYSGNIDTTTNSVTTGKLNGSSTEWTGEIDEAKIYSVALTQDEVITNYRAGLAFHSN